MNDRMSIFFGVYLVVAVAVSPRACGTEVAVVDALNQPISGATLKVLWDQSGNWYDTAIDEGEEFTADDAGNVNLPVSVNFKRRAGWARVTHPDYGTAQVEIGWDDHPKLVLPLVKRSSPAFERALKGVVLDPDGKPVADALVKCSSARTAGEGLVQSGTNIVVTDAKGNFALYLPDNNRRKSAGSSFRRARGTTFGLTRQKMNRSSPRSETIPPMQRRGSRSRGRRTPIHLNTKVAMATK